MSKTVRYVLAYSMWFADLGLSAWLIYLCRTALFGILALFYEPGDLQYGHAIDFSDKVVSIVRGLGWLVFSIITEDRFRTGALTENLWQRFARFTGPVLLCIFTVDLILAWLQGIGSDNWLRWLVLAVELGLGLALVVSGRKKSTN